METQEILKKAFKDFMIQKREVKYRNPIVSVILIAVIIILGILLFKFGVTSFIDWLGFAGVSLVLLTGIVSGFKIKSESWRTVGLDELYEYLIDLDADFRFIEKIQSGIVGNKNSKEGGIRCQKQLK